MGPFKDHPQRAGEPQVGPRALRNTCFLVGREDLLVGSLLLCQEPLGFHPGIQPGLMGESSYLLTSGPILIFCSLSLGLQIGNRTCHGGFYAQRRPFSLISLNLPMVFTPCFSCSCWPFYVFGKMSIPVLCSFINHVVVVFLVLSSVHSSCVWMLAPFWINHVQI